MAEIIYLNALTPELRSIRDHADMFTRECGVEYEVAVLCASICNELDKALNRIERLEHENRALRARKDKIRRPAND